MRLVVLGTGGGWATAGGAACGYLVSYDGYDLWVDLGTGTLANLQKHVGLMDVDAVIVSHRHFDHFLDIYPYFLSRVYTRDADRPPPLPLYAPPGMFEHALQLEGDLVKAFVPNAVEPGEEFEAGPFRIGTALMRHPVPTLGMRVESDGSVLAYSADTGPTDELVHLARGADVLLSEATWMFVPPTAEPWHLTPTEAGDIARRAEVGRLLLTHIWPTNDMGEVAERAERAFGGPVTLASEGLEVEVAIREERSG